VALDKIFSAQPTEAVFKINLPGDTPATQTIPFVYKEKAGANGIDAEPLS